MKIWRCPTCDAGIRAPGHLRKIDVRRYCLSCSEKKGVLVERTIPSRDAERALAAQQRKERETKARERRAAKRADHAQSERGRLETFARTSMKLAAFEGARIEHFEIRLARARKGTYAVKREDGTVEQVPFKRQDTSSGHAYAELTGLTGQRPSGKHRFVVTAGSDFADACGTILHEIAHCAAGYEGGPHGDHWRSVFAAGVAELTGETPSGRTARDLHAAAVTCVRGYLLTVGERV